MKKHFFLALCVSVLGALPVLSAENPHAAQDEYERSIGSVVRHKHFYKANHFEVGGVVGVMPYDSVINHYMVGARGSWHFADHYGWEILDIQKSFASVTSFTNNLVSQYGISNMQTVRINTIVSSNFLLSPFYGKVRFFGRQVLYYDIYLVGGIGMANTDILQFSTPSTNGAVSQSTMHSGWDPLFDFGFGFKIFINDGMAILIDMRDYVVSSSTYGGHSLKSNFSVYGGLSFFLPWLG